MPLLSDNLVHRWALESDLDDDSASSLNLSGSGISFVSGGKFGGNCAEVNHSAGDWANSGGSLPNWNPAGANGITWAMWIKPNRSPYNSTNNKYEWLQLEGPGVGAQDAQRIAMFNQTRHYPDAAPTAWFYSLRYRMFYSDSTFDYVNPSLCYHPNWDTWYLIVFVYTKGGELIVYHSTFNGLFRVAGRVANPGSGKTIKSSWTSNNVSMGVDVGEAADSGLAWYYNEYVMFDKALDDGLTAPANGTDVPADSEVGLLWNGGAGRQSYDVSAGGLAVRGPHRSIFRGLGRS